MGRIRIVLAGLVLLFAAAMEPAVGATFEAALATRWQWSEGIDRITDQKVSRAILRTVEIVDMQLGLGEARLALACTGGVVVMNIDWSFKAAGRTNLRWNTASPVTQAAASRCVTSIAAARKSPTSAASAGSSPMRASPTGCASG